MFVAWRDLRFAKGRFALMGAVVVLITVLVGLLSGLTAGLARGNISAVTGLDADHLAFAAPADGRGPSFADSVLTERVWQQWARTPGVRAAEPLGVATAKAVAGSRSTAVSAFGSRPGAGLAPQPVRDGAAVLSATAAEELGVHPGDTVVLARRSLAVAAVAGDAAHNHTPVVWTSLADWQAIAPGAAGDGPHATVVALRTGPGADLAGADARLGTRTLSRGDSLTAIGAYTSENGSLQLMRGFLLAISALVIGAFFTVWTIQRTGDIAVLKALGASTRRLTGDALGQAAVLLVLGTALGSGIAAAAGAAVSGTVPFVLDAPTLLLPALVMVALGSAGAALAVRRITSVDPLTALGSTR
ncbi:ABC transporter permease [Kitasatospora sp. DSM 101779]|uniref:ABC transporter permease n=1 Tax=Kitasatospora sp. DSM 101779 TaxID=2853165 RepID=UPI0021DAA583|nr:ABC transporter permease [Kitasatospora sp. DSM 101779]MCU7822369.1 ABC transporter permease [Kitasatospora sp. DSM 101779]